MFQTILTHIRKRMGVYILLFTLAVLSVSIYSAEAIDPTRYVTQTGAGTRSGSSWSNAMGEAEFASQTRVSGTTGEFWVAEGVYRPSVTGDTSQSFHLQNQMKIYGGFKGDETALSQRNPLKYKTVLTGDLGDDDLNKADGITESADDILGTNSKTVVVIKNGTIADTALDGVTVTAGDNAGGSASGKGGGIYIETGSPLIKHCTVIGNRSAVNGAGLATSSINSEPSIDSCTFIGNITLGQGGAIFINSAGAYASIKNCTFYTNKAANGGAVYFSDSGASMINCSIKKNNASVSGGGLYVLNGNTNIKNTILYDDISPDGAEIKLGIGTTAAVSYCVIENGFAGGSNIIQADPEIGVPYDNGGYTKTMLFLNGNSPAINAGATSGAPSEDQRGISRSSGVDIGSVEYSTTVKSVYVTPSRVNIKVGEQATLMGMTFPAESNGTVTWTSSDTSKATVSNGVVTAHKVGQVTITASYGGFTDTAEITIVKKLPVILNLPIASYISYGQTLANSTLSGGTADVSGTFRWEALETAPSVSDSDLTKYNIVFEPDDSDTYDNVVSSVTITVYQATPNITLSPSSSSLVYGQPLSDSTLSGGTANTPGTFSWSNPATVPNATVGGSPSYYMVTFTPDDSVNYTDTTADVAVEVAKANSVITSVPSAGEITYLQTLANSTLTGGTANVPGTFSWSDTSVAPSVSDSGITEYNITFTPTDSSNYNNCFGTATLVINKANPSVTSSPDASEITYGQKLSSSTLSGGSGTVAGTFSWSDPETVPSVSDSMLTEYPITFIPQDEDNYNASSTATILQVNRAETQYIANKYEGIYDAGEHSISVSVTVPDTGYTIKYGTMAGVYNLDLPPAYTDAGSKTIYFEITSPNHTTEQGSSTVDIMKANSEITSMPAASDLTYGQQLADSGFIGGSGSVPGTFAWLEPSTVPTVADSGVTYFDIVFNPEDSGNYNRASGSIKLTVDRAETQYTATGFDGPYDKKSHGVSVVLSAPASGGTVMYGTEEGAYNLGASPEYLGAGNHRVYFRITSPNHTTVESFADILISKAEPVITAVPTGSAIVYGQTLEDSTLSGGIANVSGTFEWKYPDTMPSVSDSNITEFPVTFTPDDSSNYSVKELTAMLGVNRAVTLYDITEYSGTYDGLSHGISVSVIEPAEGYSLMFGTKQGEYTSSASPVFSDAGSHTVYFRITSANHTEIESSGAVNLEKATPIILSAPTASGITYGQTLSDSVLVGGSADMPGTFSWTTPGIKPEVKDSEVTGYEVTFTPDESTNYGTALSSTVLRVEKADLVYSAPDFEGTYDVSSHGIAVTVTTPEAGASVVYGNEPGNYPYSTSPVFANAGNYTVYFKITATNYNEAESSAQVKIEKALPQVLAKPSATSIVYGHSLADSTLINGIGSVGGSFDWADPSIVPSVADSDTTLYEVLFTPNDADNYLTASTDATLTVAGASMSYTSDGYSGTYDGLPHAISVSVHLPATGSTIMYGTEYGEYTLNTPPAYTNAGSYTTYFEISAENYVKEYGSQEIYIDKAAPVISDVPSAGEITYGQALSESVLAGGSTDVPGTFSWTIPATVPSVSDSETTAYEILFTPDDEDNYSTASDSLTLKVNRAQTIYSATGFDGPYDRNPHTVSITVTTPASGATVHYGSEPEVFESETPPSYMNAGEYPVYFRITSPNHTEEKGLVQVIIKKASTEITDLPTSSVIVYGSRLKDSFLSGGSGSVAGSFSWADENIIPSVADSEVTEYGIVMNPYDSDNYEQASGVITVRVEKASIDHMSEGYEGVYDGLPHSITVNVYNPVSAVVSYGTDPESYNMTTPPLFTEVGSHTAYYKIEDPNYNTVTGSASVVIKPMDLPVEVNDNTMTDSEYSGVLTVGKNTVEDFAIYDALVDLDTSLAGGIDPDTANAIPAVSADITTSVEIFSPEEIKEAVSDAWNITPDSRDIALTVSVLNTVGTDSAYQNDDGSLFAKAYRFIVSLFKGRTGDNVGDSDYLPLEVKMTVTAADIEKLPDEIKNGLSANNFLEKVSLFVLTHGDTGAHATNLCDITDSSIIDKYVTVTKNADNSYTVKSRFLVFNMPGAVPVTEPGAPFVQLAGVTGSSGVREDNYYLVQDGIRDEYYDMCSVMAVRTLKGKLKVTIAGELEPSNPVDWTLTGTAHQDPASYTGTQELLIEQDSWNVNIPDKEHYDLSIIGETSKDLRWGDDWNITAEYLKIRVTGLSTDIIPEETMELRFNKEEFKTHRLHAEVVPSDAFERGVTWSSSDISKVSVDDTGLVTAHGLTLSTVYITATSVDGGYTASQPVKVTNIVTSVSIPNSAEIRVGGATVTLTAEIKPDDASNPAVTWESSDVSKATINGSGVITAISAGTVTITATAMDGDGSPACKDTCVLTILPAIVHVTGVKVEPAAITLNTGYSQSLKTAVTPEDATDKTVSWSTSDSSIATVSTAGRVTAIAEGTATITATSTDGDKTGTCIVTVNNIPQPVVPLLPSDIPDSVRKEVKPVSAEFTDDITLVTRRIAPGTISEGDLTTDPVTGLVQVKNDLAVSLFNGTDLYEEITDEDITALPVFAASVETGKTGAVAFTVKGADLFADTPEKVMVMKVLSSTSCKFFTYAKTSAEFGDRKFTIQTTSDPLYRGTIEDDEDYRLVLFIKDGELFDLDGNINGEIIDPAVIVRATEKESPEPEPSPAPSPDDGGGGCSTTLPVQMLLMLISLAYMRKNKK